MGRTGIAPPKATKFSGPESSKLASYLEELSLDTRHGRYLTINEWRCDVHGEPMGVASELADVVIRVADMAEWYEVDLAQAREEDEDLGEAKQAYLEHRLSGNLDSFGEWIAAIHEDVGDAGYHQRNRSDNLGSHLVAVIWMVQEMAAHYGIDLDAAIEAKMQYNRTYRHGRKAL